MKKSFLLLFLLSIIGLEGHADCGSSSVYSLSQKEHCIAIVSGSGSGSALGMMSTSASRQYSPQEADTFCKDRLNKKIDAGEFSSEYSSIFLQSCANQFGYSYN